MSKRDKPLALAAETLCIFEMYCTTWAGMGIPAFLIGSRMSLAEKRQREDRTRMSARRDGLLADNRTPVG